MTEKHAKPVRWVNWLLVGALPALLFFSACGKENPKPQATPVMANSFVGDAACKECHQKEIAQHEHSRHANALRPVTKVGLGEDTPSPGDIANTAFQWEEQPNGFGFGYTREATKPVQLAFGSGKSGIAFLAVVSSDKMAEAHLSYYPPLRKWFVTPGQQALPPNTLGNLVQGDKARQCLGCHTATIPEHALMPEEKFMGVRCESCHGPCATHVDAQKRKDKAADPIEKLGSLSAEKMNLFCGRCHRTAHDVEKNNLNRADTDKFQGFGLMLSKCYKESQKLSCITCHEPHQDTPQDSKPYIEACQKCHGGSTTTPTKPTLMQAKTCPKEPKGNCIPCHMPMHPHPLFPGSPRRIADHHIQITKSKSP